MPALPPSLTLRAGEVVLRGWRDGDEPALEPLFGDPDVARFSWLPPVYSRIAAREHIRRLHAKRAAGELLSLAVTRNGDVPVGNVNLVFRFPSEVREAALGYWISPAARRQGLAVAAATLLCDWGFRELALERIELLVERTNVPSQRVAERLGAVVDGITRHTTTDGSPCEMVRYSLAASTPERPGNRGNPR